MSIPKKRKKDAASNLAKALEDVDQALLSSNEDDEEGQYCRSLACKLRRLTPYQKALARRQFENIIFDIEFGPTHPPAPVAYQPSVDQPQYEQL